MVTAKENWDITVTVPEFTVEESLSVNGTLNVGGVIHRLTKKLNLANDWSDYCLWWPEKNKWLLNTRLSLEQCGIQAADVLELTRAHKEMVLQLPDLQFVKMNMNFTENLFKEIISIGKQLDISHPEEMSLMIPHFSFSKKVRKSSDHISGDRLAGVGSPNSNGDAYSQLPASCTPRKLRDNDDVLNYSLQLSPAPPRDVLSSFSHLKSTLDKTKLSSSWLNSSLSLMEQNIKEKTILCLRFKYLAFFDLDPKHDLVRINQIYEQAKYSILHEELDCTDEEIYLFASLQLQVSYQSQVPQTDSSSPIDGGGEDIETALDDLENALEGAPLTRDLSNPVHHLSDMLYYLKPSKKNLLKGYKKLFFILNELDLIAYYEYENETNNKIKKKFHLKGCESYPQVNVAAKKYRIRLSIAGDESSKPAEIILQFSNEEQYASWMAAFRLCSRGKTTADASYAAEVSGIRTFLRMQTTTSNGTQAHNSEDICVQDFVPLRFYKRHKPKQVSIKISDAHSNVINLNLMETKMQYIKAWQALPGFGISYFVVKFRYKDKKKLEQCIIGVTPTKMSKLDSNGQNIVKTWYYNTMKAWHVNWDVKELCIEFDDEDIFFQGVSCDIKLIHEFLGAYVFLATRSKEKNEALDEQLFYELTGGFQLRSL